MEISNHDRKKLTKILIMKKKLRTMNMMSKTQLKTNKRKDQ